MPSSSCYDALSVRHLLPHLPAELRRVPRANIRFLPIENAWFSGSMNYLGRARRPDGTPEYEATYEMNAALQISVPEFAQLVSHEVVPGHVTTFAYLQDLFVRGKVGFEASVLTMNTRAAALFEGIANNAILIAHGVTEVDELPDDDLQIGMLLALLQDDAKNQCVLAHLERRRAAARGGRGAAPRLPGAPTSAPTSSRARGAGTRCSGACTCRPTAPAPSRWRELRRDHAPGRLLPALYGASGLVDSFTLPRLLAS